MRKLIVNISRVISDYDSFVKLIDPSTPKHKSLISIQNFFHN